MEHGGALAGIYYALQDPKFLTLCTCIIIAYAMLGTYTFFTAGTTTSTTTATVTNLLGHRQLIKLMALPMAVVTYSWMLARVPLGPAVGPTGELWAIIMVVTRCGLIFALVLPLRYAHHRPQLHHLQS